MKLIGTAFLTLGVLNFVITAYFICVFGVDALNGMVHGGHFYLGHKSNFTLVPRNLYLASLWNGRSQMVSWPLGMVFISMHVFMNRITGIS